MNWLELGVAIRAGGRAEQRVPCPQCAKGDRDDALGVNAETGLFHCFRCGWSGKVGAIPSGSDRPAAAISFDDPAVAERKRERLRKIYRESVALTHPRAHAVRQYLIARGLGDILRDPPRILRAHPGLEYWDGTQSLGTFPAMLALFQGSCGEYVTLHATYLRADGSCKAMVPSPKKILGVPLRGATRGGAIQLYAPIGGVLGVCEGIESALSLHVLNHIPVWSSYCAEGLARIRLPDSLRELHIGVDVDASGTGERVALALAARVTRWNVKPRVILWRPDMPGPADLNDELRRKSM